MVFLILFLVLCMQLVSAIQSPDSRFTLSAPPNGKIEIDFTADGHIQLGISQWQGPAFTVHNFHRSKVSALVSNEDTFIIYASEVDGYMNMVAKHSGIKYSCLYRPFVNPFVYLTTYDDKFTVTRSYNCNQINKSTDDTDIFDILQNSIDNVRQSQYLT